MQYDAPIRIGISACLLGQTVRYNGGHKHSCLCASLAQTFEFVPLCPEVAIGMGIPRPPIHLIGKPDAPRAVGVHDPDRDVTEALDNFGKRMADELADICGFILMQKSPSCGLGSVPLHQQDGQVAGLTNGIFASALIRNCPELPVVEEAHLHDPARREAFLRRVQAYANAHRGK